jgi:hypothetical protein
MMTRISSNLTLVFRLFIPVFFAAFYGVFTIVTWIGNPEDLGYLGQPLFRYSNTAFFFSAATILFLTVWKLKRIEFTETHIYVTNYFKTYRYVLEDIASMNKTNLFLFSTLTIKFHSRTYFGKSVVCMIAPANYKNWANQNESLIERLFNETE